jgi:IS30 family transposase
MTRTKSGKIKDKYRDILPSVTIPIQKLVSDLLDRELTPEEIVGIIAGQATIAVSSEIIKRRIKDNETL